LGLRAEEGPDRKICDIFPRLLIASAGDPPSRSFIDGLKKTTSPHQSMAEVSKQVSAACAELWHRRVEQAVLCLYAQTTYSSFLAAVEKKILHDGMVKDIWEAIKKIQGGAAFLVASGNGDRAELYSVADGDGPRPLDSPGFGAIGIGGKLAMASLYQNGYQTIKNMPLPRAIYAAYEAKRAAESEAWVGKSTDMAVLTAGQDARFFGAAEIAKLEDIYQNRRRPLTDAEASSINDMLNPKNAT
jgi:hypothetical protein